MRLLIGLEQEFFVTATGSTPLQLVVIPAELPHDECGLLAEARGLPFDSPEEAVFSLEADIYRLENRASKLNLTLEGFPIAGITKQMRLKAARIYSKGQVKHENLYGYEFHRNASCEQTAGIHISFTNPQTFTYDATRSATANVMFDWVKIFRGLDEAFAQEIKDAKRNKGFYELKQDGRIEYRSLPSNANHKKIIETLKKLIK